ncbi:putative spc97 spc98 family protein [Erysiphe neolycopersici]|uniref:Spindle pole body component n=1 Tax=Erysiphe neolycopersici TaxID=212602 RepID=A0A420HMV8_9PEZI|nr:putative spc97 spc98 family protein [Erysiphe neolycopersici]
MSHISVMEALLDELIRLILSASLQSNFNRLSAIKCSAFHLLHQHNFARTNPFEVESQLDGLDEKFRIYGKDNLADALSECRSILNKNDTKWTPEILHFLLEISHRPVSSSKLENLEYLKEPQNKNDPLKWSDILSEDALPEEKEIWDNVNFADESTDEEYDYKVTELETKEKNFSQSTLEIKTQVHPDIYIVESKDIEGLKKLRESQFWQKIPNVHGLRMETIKKSITELQAIREVLFMFGGYPTSLFEVNSQDSMVIEASKNYVLKQVSHDCFMSILQSLASQGTIVTTLRLWAKRPQINPLLQAFQLAVVERLDKFDKLLSRIHQTFLSPVHNTIVSLLKTWQEITPTVQFLAHLAEITNSIEREPNRHAFLYLEMLYNLTCTSQMAGDDTAYSNFGNIFFECFHNYLQPVRAWIEEGELREDDKNFFVCETTGNIEPSLLWESRYKIRKTKDGVLHVPSFLKHVAYRIFNTGKSIVLLKYLNKASLLQTINRSTEPSLDFETVCKPEAFQLVPFIELFNCSFEAWVSSKHQYAASLLKETLFNSCGLHTSLDALSHIYYLADGSVGSFFTAVIFKNLNSLKRSWSDRFTLTEHARNSFSSISSVSSERLNMSLSSLARNYRDVKKRRKSVRVLSTFEIKYQLSWPIQIIVTPEAMLSYQRIFIFLLQVRRSSHSLSRETFKVDRLNSINKNDEQALFYSLRMRLLWFAETFYYYLTCLVLEPCTQKMKADLKAAEDIDMMIKVHKDYIKRCIDQTLLGKNLDIIYNTILKVLDLGIRLQDARVNNDAMIKFAIDEQNSLMDLSFAGLGLSTENHHYRQKQQKQKYTHLSPNYYRKSTRKNSRWINDSSSSDQDTSNNHQIKNQNNVEFAVDIDHSILSSPSKLSLDGDYSDTATVDATENSPLQYISQLHRMKAAFHQHVQFIARGLKGVARATTSGDEARLWDTLSDMLEIGLTNYE